MIRRRQAAIIVDLAAAAGKNVTGSSEVHYGGRIYWVELSILITERQDYDPNRIVGEFI